MIRRRSDGAALGGPKLIYQNYWLPSLVAVLLLPHLTFAQISCNYSITPTAVLTFAATGGSANFTVNSSPSNCVTGSWSAGAGESNPWISVSPITGTNKGLFPVTVMVAAICSTSPRTASVNLFSGTTAVQSVTINQAGATSPLTVTTASLPNGMVGVNYGIRIAVSERWYRELHVDGSGSATRFEREYYQWYRRIRLRHKRNTRSRQPGFIPRHFDGKRLCERDSLQNRGANDHCYLHVFSHSDLRLDILRFGRVAALHSHLDSELHWRILGLLE